MVAVLLTRLVLRQTGRHLGYVAEKRGSRLGFRRQPITVIYGTVWSKDCPGESWGRDVHAPPGKSLLRVMGEGSARPARLGFLCGSCVDVQEDSSAQDTGCC